MNFALPGPSNNDSPTAEEQLENKDPYFLSILKYPWYRIYSWPKSKMPPKVQEVTFDIMNRLEAVLFQCNCTNNFPKHMALIQITSADVKAVMAVEIWRLPKFRTREESPERSQFIQFYKDITKAVETEPCTCKPHSAVHKTVILPLHGGFMIQFRKNEDRDTKEEFPIMAYLLSPKIPTQKQLDVVMESINQMNGKPGSLMCTLATEEDAINSNN